MATYEYRSKTGDVVCVEVPMTEAPHIGHVIVRGGVSYRRVASSGTAVNVVAAGRRSAEIRAPSLPTKDQMDPGLHKHVDGWTPEGFACFSSVESAKWFSGVTRDKVEKDGKGQFFDYGDGPGGVETEAANKKRKRIKFDK